MNILALENAAIELRKQLNIYKATDPPAMVLYNQLEGLMTAAERGEILQKMEAREIPGHRIMDDSNLRGHRELSEAYSNFFVELIEGRETETFKMIQDMIKKLRP
jgi:hypothetical protein